MEVIKTWSVDGTEISKMEMYKMSQDGGIKSLKNVESEIPIEVYKYMYYKDVDKKTGKEITILSILTASGNVFACQSETFKRMFGDIIGLGLSKTVVNVSHGKTSAGRDFIQCILNTDLSEE